MRHHLTAARTVCDYLDQRARENPDRPLYFFVSYPDGQPVEVALTVRELRDRALAVAAALQARGLGPEHRVMVPSLQMPEDFAGFFGCLYAGVPFILLPPPVDAGKATRFRAAIESADPALLLTSHTLNRVMGGLPNLAAALQVDPSRFLAVEEAGDGPAYRPVPLGEESVAYVQYSSGSTSSPKGVVVSHGNVLANVAAGLRVIENNPPSRTYLIWAPVFHNVGLITAFSTIVADMSCVWMRPLDFMARPSRWFERISHHRADYTFASNSAVNYCTRAIRPEELDGLDLSSLVSLGNGSEPIDMDTLRGFAQAFGRIGFRLEMFNPGYGLAEATSMASASTAGPVVRFVDRAELGRDRLVEVDPGHPGAKEMVAVGKMAPGNWGVVVHPETRVLCPPGEIGELWIQGPSNAVGYFRKEEETRETFGATHPDLEGRFLRTGDLGAFLDGHLFITGRAKELIIVNGHNFYSTDLHQTVKQEVPPLKLVPFAAFSVEQGGREAVICAAEAVGLDPGDFPRLADAVIGAVSRTWEFAPDDVLFVAEGALPRTDTGKVQLLKTRQQYLDGALNHLFSMRDRRERQRVVTPPRTPTEVEVHALFAQLLRAAGPLSTDENFFLLGGTSMTSAELVARVEAAHGVQIPLKLFLGRPTIAGVAEILDRVRGGADVSQLRITTADLRAEVQLDPSIRPGRYDAPFAPAKNLFLTGATGFLGAYLLRELVGRTQARIHCLVRADGPSAALDRIRDNAAFYRLWSDAWRDRIVAVPGDVALPRLGIAPAVFDELARTIDTIVHGAAVLNFVYPYAGLRDANVGGTEECLRLACLHRPKYFHHVSTFGVYDNPSYDGQIGREEDPLDHPDGYFVGYLESKWVAEKLVHLARDRGLACAIHRPGEVSGDAATGIWKEDAVVRNIVACLQLGAMPDIATRFHLTPVDYVARAIVEIAAQESSLGKSFNLVNQDARTVREMLGFAREYGYRIDLVSFAAWRERLFAADSSNALKPLEPLFRDEGQGGVGGITERVSRAGATFSVDQAESVLRPIGVTCPPIDSRLLTTYFDAFVAAGYLAPPDR